MKHYTLEDFAQGLYEDLPDFYEGKLLLDGKEIKVSIDLDGETDTEKVEVFVNKVLNDFTFLLQKAKECIALEYLYPYNEDWRFTDEGEKEELSKETFMEALSLQSMLFYGAEDVSFFFDDNDMFLGHTLIASHLEGKEFGYAEMFG